jgi:hypothetical protein
MASESEDDWWNENCAVLPPEGLRLFLVGILGTFVATTSFIFNVFLFFVLIANRQNRRSHFIYLIFLALIDSFLSGKASNELVLLKFSLIYTAVLGKYIY